MKKLLLLVLTVTFFSVTKTFSQQKYILKKGYTVAFTETNFEKMIDATSTGDRVYFKNLIQDGKIYTIPNNKLTVYLIDRSFTGTCKVRVVGKDMVLWTVYESLKKK